jgi:uncharacterized RDD family membrane protein YckC
MIGAEKIWYWRRHLAIGLDFVAFALVFVALAALIFGSESNVVRLGGFGLTVSYCQAGTLDPSAVITGNAMMPGVTWNQAAICVVSSFGLARDRVAHLARVEKGADKVTRTVAVKVPIDAAGKAVRPFYLDWIGYVVFVAVMIAFQASRWQATPAMRLLRLRVIADDGGRAGWKRLLLRLIYAALIMLAVIAVFAGPVVLVVLYEFSAWVALPGIIAAVIGYILLWRPFEYKPSLPRAAFHDILAKTRVIRVVAAPH